MFIIYFDQFSDIFIELPRAASIGKDDISKNALTEKSGTVGSYNVTVYGWGTNFNLGKGVNKLP